MSKDTKKIIFIAIIAVIFLNYATKNADSTASTNSSFDKKVIEAIKNNKEEVLAVIRPQPQNQVEPEEDPIKKALQDKAEVDIGNTPVLGNKNAPIMIVVFSDFQCPFSKRGADTVNAIREKYGNKVNFVYKNLPLGFHPNAMPAAKAAVAAGRQGKFYDYHDKLFENQGELGEELYVRIAKELGLNMNQFNKDRNSPEIEAEVKADAAQANKLGFNGTPGFTLNGVKILGAYPQEHFEKIIDALNLG